VQQSENECGLRPVCEEDQEIIGLCCRATVGLQHCV